MREESSQLGDGGGTPHNPRPAARPSVSHARATGHVAWEASHAWGPVCVCVCGEGEGAGLGTPTQSPGRKPTCSRTLFPDPRAHSPPAQPLTVLQACQMLQGHECECHKFPAWALGGGHRPVPRQGLGGRGRAPGVSRESATAPRPSTPKGNRLQELGRERSDLHPPSSFPLPEATGEGGGGSGRRT